MFKKRIIGFLSSLILTLITFFFIATSPNTFLLLGLAITQMIVQSICFLSIKGERGLFFVSTLSVVVIIIAGTLWIMPRLMVS